jgi:hypothetical protein
MMADRMGFPKNSERRYRNGNEAAWWGQLGIDAVEFARALWLESHPLPKA